MGIDLRRLEIGVVVILPLAGQRPVDTIIDVGANDQGILQIIIRPNGRFFFMQHVDQAGWVDHWRFVALLLGQGNRQLNKVNVVILFRPAFSGQRLQRPFSPGLALSAVSLAIVIHVNRLQPWRAHMFR